MSEPVKTLSAEYFVKIGVGIVLSVVTCGMYNIYWNYLQMKAMNELLGRAEYDFVRWILLTIVTCGLYHLYFEYRMGSDLCAYLKGQGRVVDENLPLIGLVMACFGMSVITDAVYQHELNKLIP